jgi:hypothetical protein
MNRSRQSQRGRGLPEELTSLMALSGVLFQALQVGWRTARVSARASLCELRHSRWYSRDLKSPLARPIPRQLTR